VTDARATAWAEWRILGRDATLLVAVLVLGLVCVHAVWYGRAAWAAERRAVVVARADEAARYQRLTGALAAAVRGVTADSTALLQARAANAVGVLYGARVAARPPAPLGALAIGATADGRPTRLVTSRARGSEMFDESLADPETAALLGVDLATVVVLLLPLVLIAVAHDAGDDHAGDAGAGAGPLALAVAYGGSRRRIVATRVAVRAAVPTALVVAAGVVAVLLAPAPRAVPRLGAWTLLVVGYAAAWAGGIAVAAWRGATAGRTLLVLLGAWSTAAIALPALQHAAVDVLAPAPVRATVRERIRLVTPDATARAGALLLADYRARPAAYGGRAPDTSLFALRAVFIKRESARQLATTWAALDHALARRRRAALALSVASPVTATYAALLAIAGTDDAEAARFDAAVEAYREQWTDFITARILAGNTLTPADYAAIPAFDPTRGGGSGAVADVAATGLLPLAAFAAAALVGLAFTRSPPGTP